MEAAHVSAIIAALAGICGVLLGNSFVAIKEWVVSWRKRKRDAEYLVIIVASQLERFATDCLNVAYDDGTTDDGTPAGNNGNYCQATTKEPTLEPLDLDVEWKSLPQDLLYAVMRIPDMQRHLARRLAGVYDPYDFPMHTDYFVARRRGYAQLGQHVAAVAKRLREHTGLPIEQSHTDGWSVEGALCEALLRIEEDCKEHEKRAAAFRARVLAKADWGQKSADT